MSTLTQKRHVGYCFHIEAGDFEECPFSNNDVVFTTSSIITWCDVCSGRIENERFILIREEGVRGLLSVHVQCAAPCEIAIAVHHAYVERVREKIDHDSLFYPVVVQ